MPDESEIDTEMYLRDGMPYACVCKVQLRDGRIGIGVFRQDPKQPGALEGAAADRAALGDALENVPDDAPVPCDGSYIERQLDSDDDLQASLGQKAHE